MGLGGVERRKRRRLGEARRGHWKSRSSRMYGNTFPRPQFVVRLVFRSTRRVSRDSSHSLDVYLFSLVGSVWVLGGLTGKYGQR